MRQAAISRLPAADIAEYRAALLTRFSNPRAGDQLARIAADGSTKLVVRTLPTIRAERSAGRVPIGCATTIAAWILHLRGLGAPIKDARSCCRSRRQPIPVSCERPYLRSWTLWSLGSGAIGSFVDAVIGQAGAIQSQ